MKTIPFGNSGLLVSPLGFGAWPIGGTAYGATSRDDGLGALRHYLELGGRLIDTARGYRSSETMIGEVLRDTGMRSEIVIASKTQANTAGAMRKDLETSLNELGTDYLDLYYLHQPPAEPSARDTALAAMLQFQEEGKIRVIGASISGPNVTAETEQMCRDYIATGRIGAIQLIFSIFRQRLRAILPLARKNGVGIVGRTALESGFLTGKYAPGSSFAKGDHRNRWPTEKRDAIFESVKQLRALTGETSPPVDLLPAAIRFAMDEPGVDSVILGAKNPVQTESTFRIHQIPPLSESLRQNLIAAFSGKDSLYNLPK